MRKKTERTFELSTAELHKAVFDYLVNVKYNHGLPEEAGASLTLLKDGQERCMGARFVVLEEEDDS